MPLDERKELKKIQREIANLIAREPTLRTIVQENESLIALAEQISKKTEELNHLDEDVWLDDLEALEKERCRFAPELTPDEARKLFQSRISERIMRGDFGRVLDDQLVLLCGVAIYIYEKKYRPLKEEVDRDIAEFQQRREGLLKEISAQRDLEPEWVARLDELVERRTRYENYVELNLGEKLSSNSSLLDKLYYSVCSSLTYYRVREAFGLGKFHFNPAQGWPTLSIDEGGVKGVAKVLPQVRRVHQNEDNLPEAAESLARQMTSLTDLDADVLDILYLFWQLQAKSQDDPAFATVDDLLRIRGLQPKLGGQRRRGGYGPEQRREILEAIYRLEVLYVDVRQPVKRVRGSEPQTESLKSPLITISTLEGKRLQDGKINVKFMGYKPGQVFTPYLLGPGRQTSLMAAQTLRYNLRTETPEKRLSRYLSWIWKIRSTRREYEQPFKVGTLLDAIGLRMDSSNPSRTYERFEKLLDRLNEDRIISAWQYKGWNDDLIGQRGWVEKWKKVTVQITPPEMIIATYASNSKPVSW